MVDRVAEVFLDEVVKRLENTKALGDGALDQLEEAEFFFSLDSESNSIAIQIQHIHGNLMSRCTNFLTSDGEKEWRTRDAEFEPQDLSVADLLRQWEEGWACLFGAMGSLKPEELLRTITIRQEPLSVLDALLRHVGHLNYHVGQIVFLAKHLRGPAWKTLSIARGQSGVYIPSKRD